MLLAEVLEAALAEPALAAMIGRTPRIASAKFQSPVPPGSELRLQFRADGHRVRFEVWRDDKLAASGQLEATTMSTPAEPAAAQWVRQRERSSLWALRLMRTIALTTGRRVARWLLHPIALYFLLTGGAARRQSARYLERVLGRPATWRDCWRHFHAFASVVLDRVYLLQERFDEFEWRVSGAEHFDSALARRQGMLLVGAHIGSFEALRALGQQRGLRVAVVMYEDNARLINETLAAIAPKASLHVIALGRLNAMLSLRAWLDDGGIAGMLADRTLPGQSERSRTLWLPFLGAPARFSDGPFRLAALLRRPVVFMAGLYHGGRCYELRFVELDDFRQRPAGSGAALDARIGELMQRYVAILESLCREAPYNWFNFYDFWAATMHLPRLPAMLERRVSIARVGAACIVAIALLANAAAFDLAQLMRALAQTKSGEASFVERRHVAMLDQTLESSGKLYFEAPDIFVRETLKPRRERLAVNGNTLTISQGTRQRSIAIDSMPEAAVIIEAIRGTLTGNRDILDRYFSSQLSGTAERWTLELVPRDARLRGQVASVRSTGSTRLCARSRRDARRRSLGDDDRAGRGRRQAGEQALAFACRVVWRSAPPPRGNARCGCGLRSSRPPCGSLRAATTSPICRRSCRRRRPRSKRCSSIN